MNQTLGVHSEVGQLRQAVVHRPGLELSRLTPGNCRELLFDDVLWAERAREEHDAFAGALRQHGVEVHHFDALLTETLENPEARAFVLDRLCTPEMRSHARRPAASGRRGSRPGGSHRAAHRWRDPCRPVPTSRP